MAQGELGTFDIVLKEPLKPPSLQMKIANVAKITLPKPLPLKNKENDELWKHAKSLDEFYNALLLHSIYQKYIADKKFTTPKSTKINAPYLLLFYSPQELTSETNDILKRLFKKLSINLDNCAMSFFVKSDLNVFQREKTVLGEMLKKEIDLLKPEKIIIFRETPKQGEEAVNIDGFPKIIAGKQSIRLYSLQEMLNSKEKMLETWHSHLPRSTWFGNIF